jgi:hypothetical protein
MIRFARSSKWLATSKIGIRPADMARAIFTISMVQAFVFAAKFSCGDDITIFTEHLTVWSPITALLDRCAMMAGVDIDSD